MWGLPSIRPPKGPISQVNGQRGRASANACPIPFFVFGDALLKKTSLNESHREAGARMVDFGGWDMPVNYGSQIEEHHAVRRAAGIFDVSHMQAVDIEGPDARTFLRRALANNVDKLLRV